MDRKMRFPGLFALPLVIGTVVLLTTYPTQAAIFASHQEAIRVVLPKTERVETRTITLRGRQLQQTVALAKAPMDSKLIYVAIGDIDNTVVGYTFFDSRRMRTLPGKFDVTVGPIVTTRRQATDNNSFLTRR